jgi:hypothetical protein
MRAGVSAILSPPFTPKHPPMNNLKKKYSELLALTQLHLSQENDLKNKLVTDQDTYTFFKNLATSRKNTVLELPEIPNSKAPLAKPTNKIVPQEQTKPQQKDPEPKAQTPLSRSPETPQPAPKIPNDPVKKKLEPLQTTENNTRKSSNFRTFVLEPPAPLPPSDWQTFKNLMKKIDEGQMICNSIPSDHRAQKIKNAWQAEQTIPSVLILSFNESENHLTFLNGIAKAVDLHLGSASVVSGPKWERENKWDKLFESKELRLVIASDYGLYLLPNLMKHYKEVSKTAKHFLNDIPLLLLSDISLYLKEPQLKPLLWRAVCTEFHLASETKEASLLPHRLK